MVVMKFKAIEKSDQNHWKDNICCACNCWVGPGLHLSAKNKLVCCLCAMRISNAIIPHMHLEDVKECKAD